MAANLITCLRMVCALGLIFCPTFSLPFYGLYAAAGLSDVLDGFVARHGGKETRLGARLDTAADTVFAIVVILKVVLAVRIPGWILIWIAAIATLKAASLIIGLVRHKRFLAEHTLLNKACGLLLFAVPLALGRLPWQVSALLLVLTCAAATAAAVQEGYCIFIGKEIV